MLNSQRNTSYSKRPMMIEIKKVHFNNMGKISLLIFRWVTNIHEHKRYYYTFDNSLLFTESIQNTTQIFPR